MAGSHPSFHALLAKGIHLYETENYVSARDVLNRGKETNFENPLVFGRSQIINFNTKKKHVRFETPILNL